MNPGAYSLKPFFRATVSTSSFSLARAAQFDDDQLLLGGQRGVQGMRPMRMVFRVCVSSSRLCHLDVAALLTL
jgi:hypothetical protein